MMTDDGHDVDIDGDHYATCPGCKAIDQKMNVGVDLAGGRDVTVFRCTCGYRSRTARQALIHQHEQHGGRK